MHIGSAVYFLLHIRLKAHHRRWNHLSVTALRSVQYVNLDHITLQGIMVTPFTRACLWATQACSDSFRPDGTCFTFSPRDRGEELAQPFRKLQVYVSLAVAVAFARLECRKSRRGTLRGFTVEGKLVRSRYPPPPPVCTGSIIYCLLTCI